MSEQDLLQEPEGKGSIGILNALVVGLPITLVLLIVVLALTGPAIGNIFSNVVNAL